MPYIGKEKAMPTQPLQIEPVRSDPEAATRAEKFKQVDPFPDISPALLSAADIEDYARVVAMLFPFYSHPDSLKPASYEARPGRKFVRWDDDGNRIEMDIHRDGSYELPPNSISFIQIEPKIRLRDYIAIRFNLRITHVHRGLLLGTGPLIDPGFSGDILIPLHNLTSESYRIRGNEGLIWIEFTKTAPEIVRQANPPYARRGTFHPIEASKTDRSIDYYFQRANDVRPIRSSIPEAVKQAATKAEEAAKSAAQAAQSASRAGLLYGGISIAAALAIVIALVIGLHQYFGQIQSNIQTTQSLEADRK
jgi:deoxycytidine triphosphate deaminase